MVCLPVLAGWSRVWRALPGYFWLVPLVLVAGAFAALVLLTAVAVTKAAIAHAQHLWERGRLPHLLLDSSPPDKKHE